LIAVATQALDDKKRINKQQSMQNNSGKKRFVNEAGAEQSVLNFEKMVLPNIF
jgi:hypothetical protein